MRVRQVPGLATTSLAAIGMLLLAGCSADGQSTRPEEDLSGEIIIDGSSTVAPLSKAIAAVFEQDNPGVRVSVRASGTGGGFEKLCNGEIAIADASRPIGDDERQACEQRGIQWEQISIANDALSVVVNRQNPVVCVAAEQLRAIYGPQATATNWNEVPGLATPYAEKLKIFSPGADSAAFDIFTKVVTGKEGVQRSEDVISVGEDDDAIVTGVVDSPGGIGYFGYSYFKNDQNRLKALQIRNDVGQCVGPSPEATHTGSYNPLSRELFIYPTAGALERPEVKAFVNFYLDEVNSVAPRAGFITLTDEQLQEARSKVAALTR